MVLTVADSVRMTSLDVESALMQQLASSAQISTIWTQEQASVLCVSIQFQHVFYVPINQLAHSADHHTMLTQVVVLHVWGLSKDAFNVSTVLLVSRVLP